MSSEYAVLWIDDDEERRKEENRSFGRDERLDVKAIEPMNLASGILVNDEGPLNGEEPDMALVDWYLHTGDYGGDGPSIEGILHDKFPEMPVYGFSSEYGDQRFMRERKQGENRFEIITAPHKLADEKIIQDIEDYREIKSKKGSGLTGILDLLGAESDYEQKIQAILPQEFAKGLPEEENYDPGGILRFARWVRHTFLTRPGLLWDEVWAATKLGMTTEAFEELEDDFSSAKYNGIFSHNVSRWWQPEVTNKIFELAKEQDKTVGRTWKDAPDLLGIGDEQIAECAVCGRDYPETVAAGKANEDPEFPVHFGCSNIENSRGSTFEDIRVLVDR